MLLWNPRPSTFQSWRRPTRNDARNVIIEGVNSRQLPFGAGEKGGATRDND
jgi:hypothetical protein